jgi:TRAP transporter 4TM/12TM fusion protein
MVINGGERDMTLKQDEILSDEVVSALDKERGDFHLAQPYAYLVAGVALLWALFQLWIASPLPFWLEVGLPTGIAARGIHLGFAFALCFLSFGAVFSAQDGLGRPSLFSLLLCFLSVFVALYVWGNYEAISTRAGLIAKTNLFGYEIPYEAVFGWIGLILLLEATRRAVGLPLAIVAFVFLLYSIFGPYMPDLIAHKGVGLTGLANYQWLTDQGVFGIPIDVAVRFIFLFVVFGAVLDRAGAGQFFIDLALSLVGRYRGGPAKASVLASGMTGMVSGSSIANTVTTGTFTIPLMKRTGLSPERAGAIEVAASVNGQIMPPIMGAAAFVMAELLGISYFDVITHAFVPAVISYIALFYIADLEAQRLGLKPVRSKDGPASKGPSAWQLLKQDGYYLLPLVLMVYLLVGARMTTGSAVFWAIISLFGILLVREVLRSRGDVLSGLRQGGVLIVEGLIQGAKNMISVALALGAAGIIVGAVGQSGLSNALTSIVEQLSMGNLYLLLALVAIISLILGMGLPTTANYLVVATLMVPVIAKVGASVGLEVPLIAAHLFVFYFGLMADVTPPVALSAYAAAGISKGDPMRTGFQAFFYSIRTAILPFVFIFNLDLLLLDVSSFWEASLIFIASLAGILAFTSLTFRWMFARLNFVQMALLLIVCCLCFRPDFFMERVSPSFLPLEAGQLVNGVKGEELRLKFYSQRDEASKWVTIKMADEKKPKVLTEAHKQGLITLKRLGVTGTPNEKGGIDVANLNFFGLAKKAGMNYGDAIEQVQLANPDRLSAKWFYLPAFALLLLVAFWQVKFDRQKEL